MQLGVDQTGFPLSSKMSTLALTSRLARVSQYLPANGALVASQHVHLQTPLLRTHFLLFPFQDGRRLEKPEYRNAIQIGRWG